MKTHSDEKTVVNPLISAGQLESLLSSEGVFVIDCRFKLEDVSYGRKAYQEGHSPGAVFLDLDEDLSSAIVPGETGRHPLPDPAVLEARLRELGMRNSDHVVVYDDSSSLHAARAWWLLVWLGHSKVQVLDGGLAAWRNQGGKTTASMTVKAWPGNFVAQPVADMWVSSGEVLKHLDTPKWQLIDARAEPRFRGEHEPIDPVAGHIPGAICLPCSGNVDEQGRFLPAAELAKRFAALDSNGELVAYCGSGVTACHNILAAAIAGLELPRLYAGSWSEWITDPLRPVAKV